MKAGRTGVRAEPPYDETLREEKDFSDEVREALNARGHRLRQPPNRIGMLNAIKIYPGSGVLSGGPDKRREGAAAGW